VGTDASLLALGHGRRLRVVAALGTRPEAVKLAPIALIARRRDDVELRLIGSGQHAPEMLEVLGHFGLRVDEDIGMFAHGQTLADLTTAALEGFAEEIERVRPDVVLVQGDTTTAFAAALAAFYARVPVAHVEAGLRTHDTAEPFPEELNRRLIDAAACFHFPPTDLAAANLFAEGIDDSDVLTTGNTIVDALRWIVRRNHRRPSRGPDAAYADLRWQGRILVTAHRRESWGGPIDEIAAAVALSARRFPRHAFLLPLHPNPIVRRSFAATSLPENVILVDPLPYPRFVNALSRTDLVVTDSGGAVEEATALGRPVLIIRNRTERPEAVEAGAAQVVGTEREGIEAAIAAALIGDGPQVGPLDVFGDGRASARIVDWLRWRMALAPAAPTPFAPGAAQAAVTRSGPNRTRASSW
jgi:UDP-N-acetylglucosamine 2-epimerase (non-hydrolysing)